MVQGSAANQRFWQFSSARAMSVGLLLTANAVPCGSHAKRQHIGWDVRAKRMLSEAHHDHSVQDMHLSSTFKKNRRHLNVLHGKPAPLERCSSEPHSVMLAGSASTAPFKPVWELKEALPPLLHTSSVTSPTSAALSPNSRVQDPLSSTVSFLQESIKNDYCGDLQWNTKWCYKRRPDGGFWMR